MKQTMKQTKQRTPRAKVLSLLLALVFLVPCLASCTPASAEGGTEPKSTAKQTTETITTAVIPTEPATTEKPTTEAVTTEAVTTEAVITETVTTDTVTEQAVTTEPTTEPNTTLPPVSEEVTTMPDVQAGSKVIMDESIVISDEFHEMLQDLAREAQGEKGLAISIIRYVLQTDELLVMGIAERKEYPHFMWMYCHTILLGDASFSVLDGWWPWVYKDGALLRLEDAYEQGLIDAEELELICAMNASYSYFPTTPKE